MFQCPTILYAQEDLEAEKRFKNSIYVELLAFTPFFVDSGFQP